MTTRRAHCASHNINVRCLDGVTGADPLSGVPGTVHGSSDGDPGEEAGGAVLGSTSVAGSGVDETENVAEDEGVSNASLARCASNKLTAVRSTWCHAQHATGTRRVLRHQQLLVFNEALSKAPQRTHLARQPRRHLLVVDTEHTTQLIA
jgi:hypothetical protein